MLAISYGSFVITLLSFLIISAIRYAFIKRKFLYYACFVLAFIFLVVGGGGVQNDAYARLEQFILLEKNNQLEDARKKPEPYDSMLRIDLQQFKNSEEFKTYLKENDIALDNQAAVLMGWFLVILAELLAGLIKLLRYLGWRKKTN